MSSYCNIQMLHSGSATSGYSTATVQYQICSTEFPFDPPTQSVTFVFVRSSFLKIRIKTHDSESRGQEEAGRTRRTSVLFTGSTALKLENALNKPP